jgi:hypothetical protein
MDKEVNPMNKKINDRLFLTEYKGLEIVLSDYSGLSDTEFVRQIGENDSQVIRMGMESKEKYLILTDISNSSVTKDVLAKFRSTVEEIKPYVKASAIVGVDGFKKHFLNFVNVSAPFKTKAFSDHEEAKEWLVEQYYL